MKSMKKLMLGVVPAVMTLVMPATVMAQTYTYTTTTASDDAAAGLFGLSVLACYGGVCSLNFLICAGLAYWTYKDAKKRNNNNAALWAVIVFFFTLIGFVVYLLTQRKDNVAANAQPAMESAAPAPEPMEETASTMESDEKSK